MPLAFVFLTAGLRNSPPLGGSCEAEADSLGPWAFVSLVMLEFLERLLVLMCRGPLWLGCEDASSTQSAGARGTDSRPVPGTGDGPFAGWEVGCTVCLDDVSEEPLRLSDRVVGGGPGGGGGSGIPGSQLRLGGDLLGDTLIALDELLLVSIAPVEAALLEEGGRKGMLSA